MTYNEGSAGAVDRVLTSRLQDYVSVKDFGAVGDGVTDDSAAIQDAVDSGAKRIHFPAGTYYSSTKITTQHTGSYYRRDTGQVFFGDGIYTILTRNQIGVPQGATETDWDANAFFAVYGSYNEFQQLQFRHCPVAIYFGQDPAQIGIELSHTSFNKMQNLLIQDCGTGILSAVSRGHYYNHYEAIHISECQIGVYFTTHSSWGSTTDNNNRNTFLNIRASRCQVGFWLENGGTNSVYSFHCENGGNTPTGNVYTAPSGLPGGLTTAAFIIEASQNSFFSCIHESCEFYIYHDARNTMSFGNLFRIDVEPLLQNFVQPFHTHFDRDAAWIFEGSFALTAGTNAAYPDTPPGFLITRANNGSLSIGNRTIAETAANRSEAFELEYVKPLGAVAALGTVVVDLWTEVTAQTSSSAYFEVTVLGNSQTDNLVHSNTFKVIAFRTSSRTLTRYYVYDQVVGRSNGANSGSNTEPMVPTLSVNVRNLVLTLTMPNRTFESVTMYVKQLYSKA